ncbi:hypothetical protein [Azotobacter beijerinckii]|uniref:Uncharacterized protein n=1 Tax=Azotobacter beijerinckii TaxID=170623 RepID=A0A1I3Z3J0_9GAMM|nr:hypothetical protein [Azotobacter beijerinckii]SFA72968.1 hypothetical protein SAMN04244571_00154 [Azotobacter beijerinckii]SFK38638.1 hypothetical protein SAMN04244574_00425 [Azotobacter beijerinckii]
MWWGANGPFYLRRAALQWLAAQGRAGYGSPADIGRMTRRQILLHYDCALRRERRMRAERIVDVGHGMAGGKEAQALVKQLAG